MDIASSRAELEDDRTWRQDEIRFLRNQLANLKRDDEKSKYRRALVPMLYAHYEGFCKVALEHYVIVVNEAGIACEAASQMFLAILRTDTVKEFPDESLVLRFRQIILSNPNRNSRVSAKNASNK